MVGTADSVLIREVSLIRGVFYREVPQYQCYVSRSYVSFLVSTPCIHKNRAKAFVQAVNCARRKAESVSLSLGLQLCSPLSIVEHSCELIPSEEESCPCPEGDGSCNPSDCQPMRLKIQQNTLAFSSSVTAHFEMAPKCTCRHKSCPKHFPTCNAI